MRSRFLWMVGDSEVIQLGIVRISQHHSWCYNIVGNPYFTPQTILLDKKGLIVWDQEGSMDDDALTAAVSALRKVH